MLPTRKGVIAALTSLSAEDRAEVVRWSEALGIHSQARQDNEPAEHAFSEVAFLFSTNYRVPPPSLAYFSRTRTAEYRKFTRAVGQAWRTISVWWPRERRIVRLSLLRYLVRVAFDVRSARSGRVGWSQMTAALRDIEVTVNAAFPGWLAAGIFQQRALLRVTGGLNARHQPDSETRAPHRRSLRS